MKKTLLLFLALIIVFLFFLIFNDQGNEYLKPYLSTYLKSQLEEKMEIEVQHLSIDYDYVEITAKINKLNTLKIFGDYALLDKTIKLNYNLKSKGFKSKKFPFGNTIDINGTAIGLFDNLDVTGKGLAFNSKLNYKFKIEDELVKNIKIHLLRADIDQLLLLITQPAYAKGKIDVDIDIPTLLQANLVKFNASINSNLLRLKLNNAQYNLNEEKLFANYHLLIPKLSKLNEVTGQKLQGEITIDGEVKTDKTLYLTGQTDSLDGLIDFTLQDKQLTSTIKDVSVQKLMYTLTYPQIFKASIVGKFDYNLATQQGVLHSQLNKAQLLPNRLTNLLKQIRGIDLTKERYTETHFNAKLNKALIDFDFNAKSRTVQLTIPNGHINKIVNTINADYKLNIENKAIRGKIKGNISKPKVTIDGSKFIQDTLMDKIKDRIGTKTLEELGIGKKETDAIKNMLGNLFK